jgi:hypothetical protein
MKWPKGTARIDIEPGAVVKTAPGDFLGPKMSREAVFLIKISRTSPKQVASCFGDF